MSEEQEDIYESIYDSRWRMLQKVRGREKRIFFLGGGDLCVLKVLAHGLFTPNQAFPPLFFSDGKSVREINV